MPPAKQPQEAILIMKHALEAGCNFWATAEHYGTLEYSSLHLIHAYFTRYPEDCDKVTLSVLVGSTPGSYKWRADANSIQDSFARCEKVLAGTKKIDILACSRVDPEVPIETTIRALADLAKEGKIGGVGISECSAATLRRAAQVCKIETVEVEVSMFTPDIFSNGVAKAAEENGIVVVAYCPLGRGVLTGSVMSLDDMSANDSRRYFPRFQKETFDNNIKLVEKIGIIATRLGVANAQVALSWIRAYSGEEGFPNILPIPSTSKTSRIDENLKEIILTKNDLKEIDDIIAQNPIIGGRYPDVVAHLNWG